MGMNGPIRMPAGGELALGVPAHGVRTYLAVRGGIDVPVVLGSRATDLVAGIGKAIAAGDELPIGSGPTHDLPVDFAPTPGPSDPVVIGLVRGPRDDWFTPEALRVLTSHRFVVSPLSNRVGVRFHGTALQRRIDGELPSEPTVRGALEVPPDGQPILFLADHPTTCGYPVIGVADPAGADAAAQLRPGQHATFRLLPPERLTVHASTAIY